jgi:SAM-dependent methyltransferase
MVNQIYNQLVFDKNKAKHIEALFKKSSISDEFEVMFYNYKADKSNMFSMENFLIVLEYLKKRSTIKKERLEETTTLDITLSKKENYRISIHGAENIKNYLSFVHRRKNHVIFKILLGKFLSGDKNLSIIKKVREKDDVVNVDIYNTRFRLSNEIIPSKKEINMLKDIDESDRNNVIFRYKHRVSLFIKENKSEIFRIDLTNVKQNTNIGKIDLSVPRYELELDYVYKKRESKLDSIYREIEILHKVIQQSNYLINKTEEDAVIQKYINILSVSSKKRMVLDARKPQSLEIQHVTDILPNKYAVTDKADGERCFLLIHNKNVYLITGTLHVKKTGIELTKKQESYNDTILDGEYIFLAKHNRHVFMAFDCLFNSGKDVRGEISLLKRLQEVDDVIKNCFTPDEYKGYNVKVYEGKFDLHKILEFHKKQIDIMMDALDYDIRKNKKYPLIRKKYFTPSLGGQDNEIFKYSSMMWNKYVIDSNNKCPYILDGLIYHPLDQQYVTTVKDSKYFEYKWKPVDKNSIDFYIRFEKDPDTRNEYILYDNTRSEYVKGKPYKVCHLFVGKMGKSGEQPTLFQRDNNKYIAYLFLNNGEVRDQEGDILKDGTVVEFYYNMDSSIDEKYRWVPMRTRYDKTESVWRYKRRYGNYIDIANRVWRSIINPFTIKDINLLSNDKQYRRHIDILRNKIDHSLILSERKENIYFQIRTNLAKPMRNFHNWIKSIIIYTYCNQAYERGKKQVVLDIGCGKGQDLMKFYYTMVALYVGLDIDAETLLSAVDGTVSRYEQLKRTHPNFPKMNFIQADGSVLLDYESQLKSFGSMTNLNKKLMQQYFSLDANKRTIFDRINCQFAIHYFLANETMWSNFCTNLDMYMKQGGYFLFTCFDGREVHKLLQDNEKYTSYYTNKKGEKKILFEIVKKYDNEDIKNGIGLGVAIDFHNALDFQEGVYRTEYLIDIDFMRDELDKRCDLEIIETDLFSNQFYIHSDFFKHIYKYEENSKTREFFRKVAEFYDQKDSVNKACFNMTKLERFFVLRRREGVKKKQKGGTRMNTANLLMDRLEGYNHILGSTTYYIRGTNILKGFTFQEALYTAIQGEKYIPKNVSLHEFYNDIGIGLQPDNIIDTDTIVNMASMIQIGNEHEGKVKTVLNGLNILVLEKDCDGDLNIEGYGKKNKLSKKDKTVILYKDENGYHTFYTSSLNSIFNATDKFVKKIISHI